MELNIVFEEVSEEDSVAIITFGSMQARFDFCMQFFFRGRPGTLKVSFAKQLLKLQGRNERTE